MTQSKMLKSGGIQSTRTIYYNTLSKYDGSFQRIQILEHITLHQK